MLVAGYSGGVGGIDNDDGSKQFERHHNFIVFGAKVKPGSAFLLTISDLTRGIRPT